MSPGGRGPGRLRRRVRGRRAGGERVRGAALWVMSAAVAAVAALLWAGPVRGLELSPPAAHVPWLLLAAGFAVAESAVAHLYFRGEAHTLSLAELPLVVGLYVASPTGLVTAQIAGGVFARVVLLRQSALKLAFNTSVLALDACVALLVFDALAGAGERARPLAWVAGIVAVGVTCVISALLVSVAIAVSEGRARPAATFSRSLGPAALVSVTNASVAVPTVLVLVADPMGAVLLVIPAATLYLAYRAYTKQLQENRRVDFLLTCSRLLARADREKAVDALLDATREQFRVSSAQLVVWSDDPSGETLLHVVRGDPPDLPWPRAGGRVAAGGDGALATALGRVTAAGRLDPARDAALRAALAVGGVGATRPLVAPLNSEHGRIGALVLGEGLGDVSDVTAEDVRLLEALAELVGAAFGNDQTTAALRRLEQLQERLVHQASYDTLTGLANRRTFHDRLGQALRQRAKDHRGAAVLFVDLDDFKAVNDALGHAAGDAVLQQVARRLSDAVRPGDTVARLGGDEFAVLLQDPTEPDTPLDVGARLLASLDPPLRVEGQLVAMRASIGVVATGPGAADADLLMRNADSAMYAAKGQGKGRVELFDAEGHRLVLARHALRADLQEAVAGGALTVAFQPVVALPEGRPVGVEALVRWHHPVRGDVPAEQLVPLAEDCGLIVAIGRDVLRGACGLLAHWQRTRPEPLTVSVNVSARELARPGFVAGVEAVLAATGADPRRLVLEITESSLVESSAAVPKLQALRARGIRIALDDFGTGYSSLAILRSLPLDLLKIDRSFVGGLVHSGTDRAFLRAIRELASTLSLSVVVEGVEDREQAHHAFELGADLAQGFLYAPPLDAARLEDYLAAHAR